MIDFGSLDSVASVLRRSPFQHFLEIVPVVVDKEAGTVVFDLPYKPDYARLAGSDQIHGGVIAAFVDIAADYALSAKLGDFVPTIDIRVDYLRPAVRALRATGRVVKAGRTIGVVDVEVTDGSGKLVALGRGTFGTRPG